ncbi:unnamed protein product [Dicrocoelium dendriticum]|nr:unnamed protein product [Dicrocoelium dendriticum]CAH8594231.1 unnamed protein product [Dicrocoelium dendriticum]
MYIASRKISHLCTFKKLQFCERHLDACRNGGQCINTETRRNGFHKCVCLPGFWGTHCEFDCTSRGCDGRGNCEKQSNSKYKCICHPAYSGDFCQFNRTHWQVDDALSELREASEPESKKQHCSPYLCCNEGTCVEMEKRILCECPKGYHRIECEKINESSPVMHSNCAIRYNARPQEFRELAFKQKQPNSLVYLGLSFLGIMTGVAILCISAFTVVWTCAGRRKRPILDAAAFAYHSVKNKLDNQKYQNPSSGKVMTTLNKCGDDLCTTDTLPSELEITQYHVTEVQKHNTLLYPIGSQFAVVHGILQCKAKLAMIQSSTVVPNNELQKYHSPNMMDKIEKPKARL